MRKGKITLWLGLPVVIGGLVWCLVRQSREPVHRGQSLHQLLQAQIKEPAIKTPATDMTNGVTATSILKDISYQAVAAYLLAFISREDDRPWYVDDVLLLLQLPKGQWMLVHAARNPRYPKGQKAGSTKWCVYAPTDSPPVGFQRFDHRPTRQEMDQFLMYNQWQFESDKSWRVVSRMVDEATWQSVLGYNSPMSDRQKSSAGLRQHRN